LKNTMVPPWAEKSEPASGRSGVAGPRPTCHSLRLGCPGRTPLRPGELAPGRPAAGTTGVYPRGPAHGRADFPLRLIRRGVSTAGTLPRAPIPTRARGGSLSGSGGGSVLGETSGHALEYRSKVSGESLWCHTCHEAEVCEAGPLPRVARAGCRGRAAGLAPGAPACAPGLLSLNCRWSLSDPPSLTLPAAGCRPPVVYPPPGPCAASTFGAPLPENGARLVVERSSTLPPGAASRARVSRSLFAPGPTGGPPQVTGGTSKSWARFRTQRLRPCRNERRVYAMPCNLANKIVRNSRSG
jgi:hypothetical protein